MDILIFDEITADLAQRVSSQLRAKPTEPVTFLVNSPGGDLAAGLAILNALRAHRGPVVVQIEGIAASAATLLCCVGTVSMADNAALMIHAPWLTTTGNASDLRDSAHGLDALAAGMASAYRAKTGKPAAEIDRLLNGGDHWMTAAEAHRFGLIDEITPARRVAAKLGNLKLPERFTLMTAENSEVTRTPPTADVVAIQDAAAQAALSRERTRRTEIRNLLVGAHAKNPALREVLDACLDDPACTPPMASQRLLSKLGENAEPLGGSWALPPEEIALPAGALTREFHAAERATRFGNLTPYGGFGGREFVRAGSDGMAIRLGARPKQVHPAAGDFREMSLTGMASLCVRASGGNPMGMSRSSVIHAAMTTSDFPELLGTTANKSLVTRFEALVSDHRQLCEAGNLVDFKAAQIVNTSFLPGLVRKVEGGEIQFGAITDGAESYQLATYARGLIFTREAMVNDDLDAFGALLRTAANAAARLERDLVIGILTTNAALSDGVALFHASHGNLENPHVSIGVAGLGTARSLMRKQKDSSGGFVMTNPRFIVCPVAGEATAEALVASLTYRPEANIEQQTPGWVKALVVVADPRLDEADAAAWYLLSDPAVSPVIRLGYLNGVTVPTVEQDTDFDRDTMKFKIRFDIACTAVGYSGAVKMA